MKRFGRREKRFGRRERTSPVVAAAERLLTGHAVDLQRIRTRRLPVWGLVSILAHADRAELCHIAEIGFAAHPSTWMAAVGRLADGIQAVARTDMELLQLQRQALVPIELGLLNRELSAPATPIQLHWLVSNAIDERRSYPGL